MYAWHIYSSRYFAVAWKRLYQVVQWSLSDYWPGYVVLAGREEVEYDKREEDCAAEKIK